MTSRFVLARGIASALALTAVPVALAGEIDRDLADRLAQARPDEIVSALAYLDVQVDLPQLVADFDAGRLPLAIRHHDTVTALRALADDTQGPVLAWIAAQGGQVARHDAYWIVNAVRIDANPAMIAAIAARPEIGTVFLNYPIETVAPLPADGEANDGGDAAAAVPEPGLVAIGAPDAWALGVDGTGVLVANIDTGVRGSHQALAQRWAGVADSRYAGHPEWAWYDPFAGDNSFPYDQNGHGTHTMGSICGGAPGDQVGVAPGAHWIAAGAIDRGGGIPQTVSDAISSFQWMIDPDGNASTFWDVPTVCSNSWGLTSGHGYAPCDQTFWGFIDACEAAGTVVVFAAGNEGFGGLRRPSDRATNDYSQMAVAALDGNVPSHPIASFSSRGPTNCTPNGQSAIKPEIAAPGVNVRSAWISNNTSYTQLSGTSMATPHIAGVVALMRQVAPNIPPDTLKQIMYDNAIDLGAAGNDNDYGHGIVDALASVQAVFGGEWLSIQPVGTMPSLVDPDGGTTARIAIDGDVEPGTVFLWASENGGPFAGYAMADAGGGEWEAVFPGFACQAEVRFYFSAGTPGGNSFTFPFNAPGTAFDAVAYTAEVVVFADDGEQDLGWTVVNEALSTGAWERGVPVGGNRGDPSDDFDGSGSCFVTDNRVFDADVDGGPTRLISPIMDATGTPDPVIRYAQWFTNDDNDADRLIVELSNDAGGTWMLIESVANQGEAWFERNVRVLDWMAPTSQMRLRFSVSDNPNNSVTEAAIDAIRVSEFVCAGAVEGDVNGDGLVNFDDVLALLSAWGPCGASCAGDFDGNGAVDFADLLIVLANWS